MRMGPRLVIAAVASLALLGGCDRNKAEERGGSNEPDRGKQITPFDQGNSQADLDATKHIRQALVADDTLSQSAKNATVVTAGGVVTLRGVVKNQAEKTAVEEIAKRHAAGNRVDNQLTFETPDTHVR